MAVFPFLSPTRRHVGLVTVTCFDDGKETAAGSTWEGCGVKGCCCIYLWMEGGREGGKGTAQYLFLIWHLTGFWYDSSSLEVLSHAVGLSLLGNSFVAPRELNCLGTVQLKHRVTRGQGTTELAPVLGH